MGPFYLQKSPLQSEKLSLALDPGCVVSSSTAQTELGETGLLPHPQQRPRRSLRQKMLRRLHTIQGCLASISRAHASLGRHHPVWVQGSRNYTAHHGIAYLH